MPYVLRYVQVLPVTTPNVPVSINHGLDNPEIVSVEIFPNGQPGPITFTWSVVDANIISVNSSVNLAGAWIVVRAL